MFRTEIVKSKNLRKNDFFVIINALLVFVIAFVLLLSSNLLDSSDSFIVRTINDNYRNFVSPALIVLALVMLALTFLASYMSRTPQRLGSMEIDSNEIKYIENDEIKETIKVADISKLAFELCSTQSKSNPAGCMNYLIIKTQNKTRTYELVLHNIEDKKLLSKELTMISRQTSVAVRYSSFSKRIIKDKYFGHLS